MRRITTVCSFFTMLMIVCGACMKHISDPCSYDPCALKAPQSEVAQLEAYLSSAGISSAVKHCSGMNYQIIAPGADKTPGVCSSVSVTYKGMLADSTVFDQTNGTPATFELVSLIDGWKSGVPLIKKGGRILLYIPPSLGYGSTAYPKIPANSLLIFDISLVDVQ